MTANLTRAAATVPPGGNVQRLRIERIDGGLPLVIEDPERLARDYFRADVLAGVGYDELAGTGAPNRIGDAELLAINRFGARSPRSAWIGLIEAGDLDWLARIDPEWDLIGLSEEEWRSNGCEAAVHAALSATLGVPYRAQAVATKMLHLKRPRLFPILDAFVVQQIGSVGEGAGPNESLASTLHLRRQGRAHRELLIGISRSLENAGTPRPAIRVLDSLLWITHPGSRQRRQEHPWLGACRATGTNLMSAADSGGRIEEATSSASARSGREQRVRIEGSDSVGRSSVALRPETAGRSSWGGTLGSEASLDLDHLLQLRVVVARVGEMDLAQWWNTRGQLGRLGAAAVRRGLRRTHWFAQARSVFAVAAHRCDEVFNPPSSVTLWRLPEDLEERFDARWEHWLDNAREWDDFFEQVAAIETPDLTGELATLGLLDGEARAAAERLPLAPGARSLELPTVFSGTQADVDLLALGFMRGSKGSLVVPYARLGG